MILADMRGPKDPFPWRETAAFVVFLGAALFLIYRGLP